MPREIEKATVGISPDFTGFKQKANAKLKEAMAGLKPTINVEAKIVNLRKSVSVAVAAYNKANFAKPKVEVEAKVVRLATSVRTAVTEYNKSPTKPDIKLKAKVKIEVDRGGLPGAGGGGGRGGSGGRGGFFDDFFGKQRSLGDVLSNPTKGVLALGQRGIRPLYALYAAALALTPVLVALASSAAQATLALVAIGPALTGITLAGAGVAFAFQNVDDGFQAWLKLLKDPDSKAAQRDWNYAWKNMSETGREFLSALKTMVPGFQTFKREAERAVLPGFSKFLRDIQTIGKNGKSTLDLLYDSMVRLGGVIGKSVGRMGDFFRSDFFQAKFSSIIDSQVRALTSFTKAFENLLRPITRLFDAASPQAERFASYLERITADFSKWLDTFTDKELKDFFKDAGDELAKWWRLLTNIGAIIRNLFIGANPAGQGLMDRLIAWTDKIKEWTDPETGKGAQKIRDFFNIFKDLPYGDIGAFLKDLVVAVTILATAKFAAKHPLLALFTLWATTNPKDAADALSAIADGLVAIVKAVKENEGAFKLLLYTLTAIAALRAFSGFGKLGKSLGDLFKGSPGSGDNRPSWMAISKLGLGGSPASALWVRMAGGDADAPDGGKGKGKGKGGGGGGGPVIVGPEPKAPKAGGFKGWITKWGGGLLRVGGGLLIVDLVFSLVGTSLLEELKGLLDNAPWVKGSKANKDWLDFGRWLDNHGLMPETQHTDKSGWGGQLEEMKAEWKAFDEWFKNDWRNFWIELGRTAVNGPDGIQHWFGQTLPDILSPGEGGGWSGLWDRWTNWWGGVIDTSIKGPFRTAATDVNTSVNGMMGKLGELSRSAETNLLTTTVRANVAAGAFAALKAKVQAVPAVSNTKIDTPGMPVAQNNFTTLIGKIRAATGRKSIDVTVDGYTTAMTRLGALDASQTALEKANKTLGAATGGYIRGPGSGTSDSIPARLSNGEFVIRADSVQKYGVNFFKKLNEQKFAEGGPVTWPFNTTLKGLYVPQMLSAGASGGMGWSGGGGGGYNSLVAFGRYLQSLGIRVSEHPAFGGVRGRHSRTGGHYTGRAFDANYGPAGENSIEKAMFDRVRAQGVYRKYGVRMLWRAPGHYDHAHFSYAKGGLVPKVFDRGGYLGPEGGVNNSGKRERVLNPAETRAYEAGQGMMGRVLEVLEALSSDRPNVNFYGDFNDSGAADLAFYRAERLAYGAG